MPPQEYLVRIEDDKPVLYNKEGLISPKEEKRVAKASGIILDALEGYEVDSFKVRVGGIMPKYMGLDEEGYDNFQLPRWSLLVGSKGVFNHEGGHLRHRLALQGDRKGLEAKKESEAKLKEIWKADPQFCESYASSKGLRALYPAVYSAMAAGGAWGVSEMSEYLPYYLQHADSSIVPLVGFGFAIATLSSGVIGAARGLRHLRVNSAEPPPSRRAQLGKTEAPLLRFYKS